MALAAALLLLTARVVGAVTPQTLCAVPPPPALPVCVARAKYALQSARGDAGGFVVQATDVLACETCAGALVPQTQASVGLLTRLQVHHSLCLRARAGRHVQLQPDG